MFDMTSAAFEDSSFEQLQERLAETEKRAAGLEVELGASKAALKLARSSAQRAADRTALLLRLEDALNETRGVEEIARAVIDRAVESVGASAGTIWLADDSGFRASSLCEGGRMEDLDGRSPVGDAMKRGMPVFLESRAQIEESYGGPTLSWSATACIPFPSAAHASGALALSFDVPHVFDGDERAFLTLIAWRCARAFERSRLREAEEAGRLRTSFVESRIAFIGEAGRHLTLAASPEQMLASIARLAVPSIADYSVVFATDGKVLAFAHHDPEQERVLQSALGWFTNPGTAVLRMLVPDQPILIRELAGDRAALLAINEEHAQILRRLSPRAYLVTPLVAGERVLGALHLAQAESGRCFDDQDRSLAIDLASRTATAMDVVRSHQQAIDSARLLDRIQGLLAHDLRNPLSAIRLCADLLHKSIGELPIERARQAAQTIERSVSWMDRAIQDIVDLAQTRTEEAGRGAS
jgi:K+-sensing histidine kinase KdpD